MNAIRTVLTAAIAVVLLALPAWAGTIVDPTYGHTITVPDDWSPEQITEGEDRVVQLVSPDGNAYGEVRAVHVARGTTAAQLRENFAATYLPTALLAGSAPETFSGVAGEVAAWTFQMDGQNLVAGGFFGISGPVGYVLVTITSESQFDAYSPQYDRIFDTFVPGNLVTTYAGEAPATAPKLPVPPTPATPPATSLAPTDRTGTAMHAGLVAEPHPELGFLIVHKDTWVADQPSGYSLRLGLAAEPMPSRPSLVVEALAGDAYVSLQAAAEDLKAQLSGLPNARFDQEGPHIIKTLTENGAPLQGWSFGALYDVNGVPFRQLTFIFKRVDPSVYYTVYVTGPAASLSTHKPEMIAMLATLKMIPFGN